MTDTIDAEMLAKMLAALLAEDGAVADFRRLDADRAPAADLLDAADHLICTIWATAVAGDQITATDLDGAEYTVTAEQVDRALSRVTHDDRRDLSTISAARRLNSIRLARVLAEVAEGTRGNPDVAAAGLRGALACEVLGFVPGATGMRWAV